MGAPVDRGAGPDNLFEPDHGGDAGGSGGTQVVRDAAEPSPARLRVDYGAHLEANYQRLVAQLYAITLDPAEAHDVVQDAYSRAWRNWAVISRSPDPSAWVRRVAVRSTIRSWRSLLTRFGLRRPRPVSGVDPRTGALLAALGRLPVAERRAVVLSHMAGVSPAEIAAVEQTSIGSVQARLARARHVVVDGMADVLPEVLHGVATDDRSADGHGPESDGPEGSGAAGYGPEAYGPDGYGGYGAEGYGAVYGADGDGDRGYDDRGNHR